MSDFIAGSVFLGGIVFVISLIASIIGLMLRKNWKKKSFILLLCSFVITVLCSIIFISIVPEDEYTEVTSTTYNTEKDTIVVDAETNLPNGTVVYFNATNEKALADYEGEATVTDGKLNATLKDEVSEFVLNGVYEINMVVPVAKSGTNTEFYNKYKDWIILEGGQVLKSFVEDDDGKGVDYGAIGNVEITGGYSEEERDKLLEEKRKEEERKQREEEERKRKEEEKKRKEEEERKRKEEEERKRKEEEERKQKEEEERKQKEAEERELQEKKANAKEIRFAELDKNPNKYYGEYVKYQGEILQIMEDETSTVIRLGVTKTSYGYSASDVIYITYDGTTPFVAEDVITVYGEIRGSYTYESQAGYQITLPLMKAEIIE